MLVALGKFPHVFLLIKDIGVLLLILGIGCAPVEHRDLNEAGKL